MTQISANQAVLEALKPLVKSHVWPYVRPAGQDAVPYIIYSAISNNPLTTIAGWAGHKQIRMQIDVYAYTLGEAETLANELVPVIEALETVSAEVEDGGSGGFENDTRLFRQTVEFLIWEQTL